MLVSLQQMEEAVRSTAEAANRTAQQSTVATSNAKSAIASTSRIANSFASRRQP